MLLALLARWFYSGAKARRSLATACNTAQSLLRYREHIQDLSSAEHLLVYTVKYMCF